MFDGRDTIVMFDKLAYEDMLPVRWCPTSETVSEVAAAQHLVERNLRVLQACDAGEWLPRVAAEPEHIECSRCPWRTRCWS